MIMTTARTIFVLALAQVAFAPAFAQTKPSGGDQPTLLGQFGDWGAYKATPAGKTVCFALSKPTSATTEPPGRSRDASYMFISTRPSEKVKNEISAIVGYPQKPGHDASAAVGSANYVLYTQNDGAWVKNAAEEAQMVAAMRKTGQLVVKSESSRGTKSTDTYSLKGIGEVRAKKIVEERGKAKFKDLADLVKRAALPANVEAEIKDKVAF